MLLNLDLKTINRVEIDQYWEISVKRIDPKSLEYRL